MPTAPIYDASERLRHFRFMLDCGSSTGRVVSTEGSCSSGRNIDSVRYWSAVESVNANKFPAWKITIDQRVCVIIQHGTLFN